MKISAVTLTEILVVMAMIVVRTVPSKAQDAGSIIAWGDFGWTNTPPDLTNVVAIAADQGANLALKADGTVTAWTASGGSFTNTPPAELSNVVAITSGDVHSMALKADGTVLVWGSYVLNLAAAGANVPVSYWPPPGLTNVVALAATSSCDLALKGDGSVVTWGIDSDISTLALPPGLTNVVEIAAGYYTRAALKADGTLVVWDDSPSAWASLPLHLTNVVALAAGLGSGGPGAIVLQADGTAFGFAADSTQGSLSPSDVISNVVTIITDNVDNGRMAYLKADGQILYDYGYARISPPQVPNAVAAAVAWDRGLVLVGDGSPQVIRPADRTIPQGGVSLLHAMAVGAQPMHYQWLFNDKVIPGATNLVLRLDNVQPEQAGAYSLVASNAFGQATSAATVISVVPLLITTQPKSLTTFPNGTVVFEVMAAGAGPFEYQWRFNGSNVPGASNRTLILPNVKSTQSGYYSVQVRNGLASVQSAEAKLEIGQVAAWGSYYSRDSEPFGLTNVLAVSAENSSAVLQSDGTVVLWGGEAGDIGATTLPGLSNAVAIAAASGDLTHGGVEVLGGDGTVALWNGAEFLDVPGLSNAVAIASGGDFDLALRADGTVLAFTGWDGQAYAIAPPPSPLRPPPDLSNVVAIAAGLEHGLALRQDGTVVAWGDDRFGQVTVPRNLGDIVAIAAGASSSLALRTDGSVVAWGSTTNAPPTLTNIVAIAAGDSYNLALGADGTVTVWGSGFDSGMLNVPTGLTNVVAIAAGWNHGLALVGAGSPFRHASIIDSRWEHGHFSCTIPTRSGRVYQLEFKQSLSDLNWTRLPLIAGSGSDRTLTDPAAPGAQRFYRVRNW